MKITIKIFKNGKTIKHTTTKKRMKILSILKAEKFKNCSFYIKVKYDKAGKWKNETSIVNKGDAILAYKAFTEKSLLNDFN